MGNYPYIIAGMPDILLDFNGQGDGYSALREQVRNSLDAKDARLVDMLGLAQGASKHFYALASRSSSRFIREYYAFDHLVRSAKVAFLDNLQLPDGALEIQGLQQAFQESSLVEREKRLDAIMWDKAAGLVTFNILDIDVILSLLVRASIADRWLKLDRERGETLFKDLVGEVRGTFKGINYE